MDLYRVSDREIIEMGIIDNFSNRAICLIEWVEKNTFLMNKIDIHIKIKFVNNETRSSNFCVEQKFTSLIENLSIKLKNENNYYKPKKFYKIYNTISYLVKDLFYSSTPNKINDVRNFFDKSLKRYRFVFDSKDKIEYEVYKDKDIIKFIFKNSMFSSNLNQIRIDKNYVKNISITKIKNNIEVKFYLNQPLNLKLFSITPQDKKGHRFVVDLTTDKIIYTKKINNNKKIKKIIAIDAGHGGKDPGAVGKRGTKEKNVVYDISKRIF